MQNASKKIAFTVRVNEKTKQKADLVAERLGISLTSAINMFVEQFVRDEAMPFKPSLRQSEPLREEDLDPKLVTLLNQRVAESLDKPGLSVAEFEAFYDHHQGGKAH